jgi:hypothetical protein
MDVAAAMRSIDPQAEALARIVSAAVPVSPETMRTALAILVALLVELGSGLGPWLVTPTPRPQPRQETELASGQPRGNEAQDAPVTILEAEAVPAEPSPAVATAQSVSRERVGWWASGAVTKRRGGFVPAEELREAFYAWCDAHGIKERLNATAFGLAMKALGYKSGKVGGEQRYFDIALVGTVPAHLRLAVDNAKAPRRALGDMRAAGRDRAAT